MNKFQEKLMKDLGWKLLSVAMAIIMWILVININQPIDTRNYTKTITLNNLSVLTDRGLTIANLDELKATRTTVRIKSQRTSLDRLSQSLDWLNAEVDLSSLAYASAGETVVLPVNVSMQGLYSGFEIVSRTPSTVEIHVENLVSKAFTIRVSVTGDLANAERYASPSLSSETVMVSGAESAVQKVAYVQATVSADLIADNARLQAQLVAYDTNGARVSGVTTSLSEVTVGYEIYDSKFVPIQISISGAPEDGYEVKEITSNPASIEVMGEDAALQKLVYIQIDNINISGAVENIYRNINLEQFLPEGVLLKNGASTTAQITVNIQPINQIELTIDTSQITIENTVDGYSYQLPESITLTLQSEDDILEQIDRSTITGTIDVADLTEGTHTRPVTLYLPEGVTANETNIEVIIQADEVIEEEF